MFPPWLSGMDEEAAQAPTQAPVEALETGLPEASSYAGSVDTSGILLLFFTELLLALLIGVLVYALVRGRKSGAEAIPLGLRGRHTLRWGAVVAVMLVGVVYAHGFVVWQDMQIPPRDAMKVLVRADREGWTFRYPSGFETAELHLPADEPVVFQLRAEDVRHGFAIPAFRLNVELVPGREVTSWVQPTETGRYVLRSTQYSGEGFEEMKTVAVVHPQLEFLEWLQIASGPDLDLPPIERGEASYRMRGCTQCHSVDGNVLVGPSFQGFASREHVMRDDAIATLDDEYIRRSILQPQIDVVKDFEPIMPSYEGRLHELEIEGLIAWLKSLE